MTMSTSKSSTRASASALSASYDTSITPHPTAPHPPFKIERDIPLHKVVTRVPSVRFPLADMKVGESFYVANRGSKQQAQRERVRVQARRLKPKQFAIRTEGDGMRVWRTK